MTVSIAMLAFALRSGLRMRSARRRVASAAVVDRRRLRRTHLRLAKTSVAMLLTGAVGGPLAMFFVLDRTPFETLHALLGALAAALFVAAGITGRRLESGIGREHDLHGALALTSFAAALAAALAGLVLLP
jgi:hypothetical protein